jgi:hypothetical protein
MIKVIHHMLTMVGFLMLPFFYIGIIIVFGYEPFNKIFDEWNRHRKSGESWGGLDKGVS